MNGLREVCWCGHAKDTLFEKGSGACLGVGCNVMVKDCPYFRDVTKPDTFVADDLAPETESVPTWRF